MVRLSRRLRHATRERTRARADRALGYDEPVTPTLVRVPAEVLASFAVYQRLSSPGSRLALVGGATSGRYQRALERMAEDLEVGDGDEAEGDEEAIWQGNGKSGTVREPPWAMRAADGLRRQVPADAAASQLVEAS